jgi:hypothetical protein
MNYRIIIYSLLLAILFVSCDNELKFDKYFLGEKFIVTLDEPAIVVDTSTQVFNHETQEWEYPEYLVEVKSLIKENRCPPNLCEVCFGGFVEIECSVKNLSTQILQIGSVDYPSCTESDLYIEGSFGKIITIGGIDFKCLSILPYYDLPENPSLKDYQVKFIGLK